VRNFCAERGWFYSRLTASRRSQEWGLRYALGAYAAWWLFVGAIALIFLALEFHLPSSVGVLIVEGAFLLTLAPLYHSGSLTAADLGLRRASGARSVGLVLLGLLAYVW
jgi:hypothetical protein